MDGGRKIDPRFADLGYSLRRYFVDEFFDRRISLLSDGALVLDIGGQKIKKRGQFDIENYPVKVVYGNLTREKNPDVQCDASRLPFAEEAFSAVLCSELLEHVLNPGEVLSEAYRVLRTSGVLLITAPFLVHVHPDPQDFGRYTDQYWRQTLRGLNFEVDAVEPQGDFWCVFLDMLRYHYSRRTREAGKSVIKRKMLNGALGRGLVWGRRRVLTAGNNIRPDRPTEVRFTTGYGIVARKS